MSSLALRGVVSGLLLAGLSAHAALGPWVFAALVPFLQGLIRAKGDALGAATAGLALGLAMFGSAGLWVPAAEHQGWLLALLAPYTLALALPLGVLGVALAWLGARSSALALAAAPLLWILLEALRAQGPLGYPWHHLGYALAGWPLLLAPAAFVGVYGLSLWIVATNALLVVALDNACSSRARAAALVLPLLPLVVGLDAGGRAPRDDLPLRIAAIQPAAEAKVPLLATFDAAPSDDALFRINLTRLVGLTERAVASRPSLIVWPETSFARPISPLGDPLLGALARKHNATLLIGARYAEASGAFRNSALLIRPDGTAERVGDKMRLFPVWEAAPQDAFSRWLSSLGLWPGRLEPGSAPGLFTVAGLRIGVLICLDTADPSLARELRARGAELLIELSNDGPATSWVAEQHARISRVRAVETGLPLIRVANTGPSEFVAPDGDVNLRSIPKTLQVLHSSVSAIGPEPPFVALGHGPAFALGLLLCLPFAPGLAMRRALRRGQRTSTRRKPCHVLSRVPSTFCSLRPRSRRRCSRSMALRSPAPAKRS